MECKTVIINKKEIRYHEWNNNEQYPTILCLHGLGSSSLSFIEMDEMLGNEYNIISLDLPGHGKSDTFDSISEYTMDNLVKWLDDFVLELNLNEFIIVGHSMGADIGIHYSSRFPEKISKLILLDGGYYNKQIQYKIIKQQKDAGIWKGLAITTLEADCDFYEDYFDSYYFNSYDEYIKLIKPSYKRLSDKLIIALKNLMTEYKEGIQFAARGHVARGAIQAMYYDPSAVVLKNIKTPTLLLISTKPKLWYEVRRNLIKDINSNDKLTIQEIDDTGHSLHWERPEYVYKIIKDFSKDMSSRCKD